MNRTIQATGLNLEAALTDAVADLLGCRPSEVDLRIDAPDAEVFEGTCNIELQVAGEAAAEVAAVPEQPENAPAAAGGRARRERAGKGARRGARRGSESEAEPVVSDTASDVRPVADERDDDRDDDRAGGSDEEPAERVLTAEDLDAEADAAADFLEGLLDAMDLPGDLRIHVHDDHIEIEMIEVGTGALIGRRGQTLESIQELLRSAMQRQFQRRSRVMVDVEGYRTRRLEKLLEKAEEAIDAVLASGDPERLEPMDVFERKAVHNLVAGVDGLISRSQGREPARRIVIERE
jgi:spoIIIJ-associated protein